MQTPRQRVFLTDPRLKEIMERLDAVPVPSAEWKMNQKISERVGSWVDQMEMAPKSSRRVQKDLSDRKPWDEVDLSHLKPGQCPF